MKPLTTARRRAGGDGAISCSQAVPLQCRPLSCTATRQAAIEQSAHAIAIVSAGRYRYVTAAVAVMTATAGEPGRGGDGSQLGPIAYWPVFDSAMADAAGYLLAQSRRAAGVFDVVETLQGYYQTVVDEPAWSEYLPLALYT
jgi:hypothetical protein